MPSFGLLAQSAVSGLLSGGLYGMLALGLSLNWGLLKLLNLSHFALAFLAAYITWHLGTRDGVSPLLAAGLLLPCFFVVGAALHWLLARFRMAELNSLLVTFGIAVMVEALIQSIWSADYQRYQSGYASLSLRLGPVYVPLLELACTGAAAALALLTAFWLRFTYAGKALRAGVDDRAMAEAFGVDTARLEMLLAGVCAMLAAAAGIFLALISTLTPGAMWNFVGVIFAVVIIGGLGRPVGAVLAAFLIGLSESLTMAVTSPAWAPLVSFSILIVLLLARPRLR